MYGWDADFNRLDPENEVCPGVLYAPMAAGSTLQSLAISENADYGPSGNKYLLVAGDDDGWLRGYAVGDVTQQATPLWERDLSTEVTLPPRPAWLSPPAIGDVGGDGVPEVVVTAQSYSTHPDTLYILDAATGQTKPNGLMAATGNNWSFWRSPERPPAGPALVEMDLDMQLEIVVPGVRASCMGCRYVTVEVFHYDVSGVTVVAGESAIPYTARNDRFSGPDGNLTSAPIGTPIVGDVDYDGVSYKPDVFITTSDGAIHAFQYDPAGPSIKPKPGWPLLLPDVAREPVLTMIDGAVNQLQLVVQCQDGWLHVFDLPGNADGWMPAGLWSSYGGDNGNTRAKWIEWGGKAGDESQSGGEGARPRISRISPVPSRGAVTFDLATRGHERIELQIMDVGGRVVRRIEIPSASPGRTVVRWDGLDDRAQRVASGVYWGVLRGAGASQARRLVVLH